MCWAFLQTAVDYLRARQRQGWRFEAEAGADKAAWCLGSGSLRQRERWSQRQSLRFEEEV